MQINLQDVPEKDRGILSPCGIACLGCELHREESLEAAKTLVKIWNGWNMEDGAGAIGLKIVEVSQVLEILEKFIKYRDENGPCRGCYHGDGPSATCSISQCVKKNGYWTCAECEKFEPNTDQVCPQQDEENANILGKPFAARSQAFELVNKRYGCTNIDNLKRCQEIGYVNFIAEMKEKVNNGWRTWQVISPEKVFLERFIKLFGQ